MMLLYFLLLTTLDLRVFDIQEEYYLLVSSGMENEELSFSTYRVPNPERVVLEIDGKISGMPEIGINEKLVSRVQLKKSEASVRFVFFVEENVFYNIFNRKNTLLIAFKKGLFLSEGNMDTVLDDVRNRLEKIRKEKEEEKKIAELKEKQKDSSVEPDRKKKSYELALAEQWKEERERKKQREEEKRKKMAAAEYISLKEKQISARQEIKKRKNKLRRTKKQIEEYKKQRRLEEKKRKQRKLAEKRRLEEEKRKQRKLAEKRRLEEKKRKQRKLAEKRRLEEKKRKQRKLAEKRRLEEKKRKQRELAEKRRLEEKKRKQRKLAEKRREKDRKISRRKIIKTEDGQIKSLSVSEAEHRKQIEKDSPVLPVRKLAKKGQIENIFFRKHPDFSRVTLKTSGSLEYRFRKIKGGYVIDVFNLHKMPAHLVHIIDARAFNAEVKYIYPQKKDGIFKIYIKASDEIAVRKSQDGVFINFDFFVPLL